MDLYSDMDNVFDEWRGEDRNIVIVAHGYSLRCILFVLE